jgi:hypothetical protein
MKRYFEAVTKGFLSHHAAGSPRGWRRRFAPLLLVLGLLGASKLTYDASPREQAVLLQVPEELRANLQGVRLTYLEDGEAVTGSEQRFSDGAPAFVRSVPLLSPGLYQLDIELSQRDGATRRLRRDVPVPTAGTLRIRLDE